MAGYSELNNQNSKEHVLSSFECYVLQLTAYRKAKKGKRTPHRMSN